MIIENDLFYGVVEKGNSPKEAFRKLKNRNPFFASVQTYLINQEDKVSREDIVRCLGLEKPVFHERKCKVYFLGDDTFYFFRNKSPVSPVKIYEEAENIISRWKSGNLDDGAIKQLEKAMRGADE